MLTDILFMSCDYTTEKVSTLKFTDWPHSLPLEVPHCNLEKKGQVEINFVVHLLTHKHFPNSTHICHIQSHQVHRIKHIETHTRTHKLCLTLLRDVAPGVELSAGDAVRWKTLIALKEKPSPFIWKFLRFPLSLPPSPLLPLLSQFSLLPTFPLLHLLLQHLQPLLLLLNIPPPPHLLHQWRNYNLLQSLSLFRSISLTPHCLSLSRSFSLSFRLAPVILFLLFQKADRSKAQPLLSPPEGFVPISLSPALCGPLSGFMPRSNSPFVIWLQNTFTHTDTQIHTVTHNGDKPPEE